MMVPKAIMKKPIFLKLWGRYPETWTFILNIGVFLKYKTLNLKKLPNKIRLSSSSVLYINPSENRGRALLISEGVTQQRVSEFWKQGVSIFEPTLVVDVGVNYGECIFSTNYPETTKIYGIEANQYLLSYIKQTQMEHNNNDQITIIHAFASDQNSVLQSFYIDKNWSGTSSGIKLPNHRDFEKIDVPTITIDSLFEEDVLNEQRLLFKVDVEGYESFVLKGMKRLFEECNQSFGLIEFDSVYMKRAGIDLDEFFVYLANHFSVYIFIEEDHLTKMEEFSFKWLQKYFDREEIHTDFILTTDDSYMYKLNFPIQS
jgi:FkbM family methyltransferase